MQKGQSKFKIKYNKSKSKDNTNYIITSREPKEAENLVSKNNLLSPNCFWTEQINGVVKTYDITQKVSPNVDLR